MPFLTRREKEILEALGKYNQEKNVAHQKLGIAQSTVRSHSTKIFKKFVEALETMVEYEPIFKGRLKRNHDEVWELTRKLRREMNVK